MVYVNAYTYKQLLTNHLSGCDCLVCSEKETTIKQSNSTKLFIEKARKVHGDKYDYSKVDYINAKTKVYIICPEHSEFPQTPNNHLRGKGCPVCAGNQVMTTEEFIRRAKEIHGDKYDYSKVEYKNRNTTIRIICSEHGEFKQVASVHLNGHCCPACFGNKKMTTKEFIKKAKEVHGDKYDYSKVKYVNANTIVHIICPEHGEFPQTPSAHANNGQGCPTCSGNKKMTTEEFIKKAKAIHDDKYDYSKVDYKNSKTEVCIICPEHGKFWQVPSIHLNGSGCPICIGNQVMTTEEFIKKAKEVHGDKYDYSKVKYVNATTKVCIICPKHGEFSQIPYSHYLYGSGCPICNQSKLEKEVENILRNNNIDFISYYKPNFLKTYKNYSQHLDYFIPFKNIAIECQGKQHYTPVEIFGGESEFEKRKKYDQNKKELCQKNGITLIYYTSEEFRKYKMFDKNRTFTDLNDLLKAIV